MLTEWVAPGRGASLGAVKALIRGIQASVSEDWKTRTSLWVDYQALLDGCRPDGKDYERLLEVLRRLEAGEGL